MSGKIYYGVSVWVTYHIVCILYIAFVSIKYVVYIRYTYVYPYPPIEINQRENVVKIKANSLKNFVYITMYTLASGSV